MTKKPIPKAIQEPQPDGRVPCVVLKPFTFQGRKLRPHDGAGEAVVHLDPYAAETLEASGQVRRKGR